MIRRPPRSTRVRSSAASDVYKRQVEDDGDVRGLPRADHLGPYAQVGPRDAYALGEGRHGPLARDLSYLDGRALTGAERREHRVTETHRREVHGVVERGGVAPLEVHDPGLSTAAV